MCDTIVIVGDDQVLFAKNSDRDANEAQFLEWLPRRSHSAGSTLRCTWIEIPQVRRTHAALISRPFWMWGAEIGTNEFGVTIGNEAVFTKPLPAKTGLTGMDLLRLALERAETADEAAELIADLIKVHGQGGGCGFENPRFSYHSSFLIADPRGALLLETTAQLTVMKRIDGTCTISNALTQPTPGLQRPRRLATWVAQARKRQKLTAEACRSVTQPRDLCSILRSHGDGSAPRYSAFAGALGAPCMHGGGLAIGSQTTASWISKLGQKGQQHWVTGTAAPCTSVFKPVRLTEPLDLGPAPNGTFDGRTLWWRHEVLHRRLLAEDGPLFEQYRRERDHLEEEIFRKDLAPAESFEKADSLLRRWIDKTEDIRDPDRRSWAVRRYWKRRNIYASLPASAAFTRR